ncbi:hypothetical protein BST27_06780 [Mycobacterium intermedium]|uniref:Uncharacterized protein n=1 Tax=Mycobacterium intermedium TaxID=28445 RepID=A0A1E3SIU3_MYCIE|nr:hypothetical protein [Mycobacterium intermedium]MCV6967245.1 hypothetical protein [Mycobacterium intermedium]ODR02060.1 hypothetical protein BHQ20_06520 [Mycobacterium intermedium]OPE50230.1 hypothetical protein BV508_11120 [Mycobacterium intermedium]ORB08984.1 hypothetical protein BST27_06780 [Mycobacterium intermedium]
MDELRSAPRGRIPEFDEARRSPAMILTGLAAGLLVAYLGLIFVPPAAPVVPFLLGLAIMPFQVAKAFALGAWAAACGVFVFLVTLLILLAL